MVKPTATSGIWNTSGWSLFISFCQVSRPSPGHHGGSGSCREKNTRNRTKKTSGKDHFETCHAIFITCSEVRTLTTISFLRTSAWVPWFPLYRSALKRGKSDIAFEHTIFYMVTKEEKRSPVWPKTSSGQVFMRHHGTIPVLQVSVLWLARLGGVPPTLEENLVHQRCALDKIIRGSKSKKTICKNDSGASALGKFHYFPKW